MATEKEKMLAGEPYLASDPELARERRHAREVLHRFNAAGPDEWEDAAALLGGLLALGEGTVVMAPFQCDYGYNIRIGRNGFVNYNCVFLDCAPITLGDDVQIAPGVQLYTATHPVDAATRRAGPEYALPITIGDGVWIGGGSIVLPGANVGENTVVGAGSVVTRDLPANVVAAGNPCRVLRAIDEPRHG
ncbi:MAG TPA: sugar O-acetyltransferase [Longimicrobium sp.]|jgi:maltose O-acetyltransferase|nr:sugar O-acetyltransferase [Longimicrobium sp.]